MLSIWEEICLAEKVLFDLTGFSINAVQELGIAHALGRDTAVMATKADIRKLECSLPLLERSRIIAYDRPGDAEFIAGLSAFLAGANFG